MFAFCSRRVVPAIFLCHALRCFVSQVFPETRSRILFSYLGWFVEDFNGVCEGRIQLRLVCEAGGRPVAGPMSVLGVTHAGFV